MDSDEKTFADGALERRLTRTEHALITARGHVRALVDAAHKAAESAPHCARGCSVCDTIESASEWCDAFDRQRATFIRA